MGKKPLLGKKELVLIAAALIALAVFFALRAGPGDFGVAYVTVDGQRVLELPLAATPDQRIELSAYGVPATLEVEDHKIRFVEVSCPDHICEQTGWVWKDGQSAVCMPNRAAVVVVEG